MHFFGLGWREVQEMPFSEFTRLAKCATMLEARGRLVSINVANFVHLKDDQRRRFHKELSDQASSFIEKKIKDYRDVLASVAKALNGGR